MKTQETLAATQKINEKLQEAIAFHQAGKLSEAEVFYKELLTVLPFYRVIGNLGIIASQKGDFEEALKFYEQAIIINPNYAGAYSNRGNSFKELNRFEEALSSYDRAVELNPNYVDAYSNRGITLHNLNRFDEALKSFDQAILLNSNYAEAYFNKGITLHKLTRFEEALASFDCSIKIDATYADAYTNRGMSLQELKRFDEALSSYDQAIAINPKYVNAHYNRGSVLKELKRLEEAIASYDAALVLDPIYVNAYANRGLALQELSRFEEALSSYDQVIAIDANHADAYSYRGIVLKNLKRYDEALISYEQSISINPNYVQAHSNLGNALCEMRRFEEALICYDRAIEIEPNYVNAHSNKGNALGEMRRFEEALICYDRAIEIDSNYVEAFFNRGHSLQYLQRFKEALISYEKAIAINPNYEDAYWNKSLQHILQGDYLEGWKLYEWRWTKEEFTSQIKNFPQPLWLGEPSLVDKTILIYPEQGLGDYIQFIRYAPLLEDLGAKVILEVPAPLMPVVSTLQGQFILIEKGKALPDFDYHCPVMSLPHAFKTTVDTIPNQVPYFSVNQTKKQTWQARLGQKKQRRVGFVCSGNSGHKNDHNRSISLHSLQSLFDLPVEFHCLQKEIREDDAGFIQSQINIRTHSEFLHDFSDTAALIDAMDLVISVDTSVAHLAGALGKETWILLPYVPDYRWMLEREDSPWYPTATLFRQSVMGEWGSVIDDISHLLKSM